MTLSSIKFSIFKSAANNVLYPSLFRSSFQRLLCAANMSSQKEDEKNEINPADLKTLRKPGMAPDVNPGEVHPAVIRYKKPKMKLKLQGIDLNKYTHIAQPYAKTGGRNWQGKVTNRRVGGGARQKIRLVDYTRNAVSKDEPLLEKVIFVRYDPLRSANIALVASGNNKRWILAGEHMSKGDIIKSHGDIPQFPAKVGDAHPLGAYPIGAVVHNIEMLANEGGTFARAAGTSGTVKFKGLGHVTVSLPSGREVTVAKTCMATCGRASNVDHGKQIIGSAQRNRWFGVRPSSGLWHKKTGYHGRKMKKVKPEIVYEKTTKKIREMFDT